MIWADHLDHVLRFALDQVLRTFVFNTDRTGTDKLKTVISTRVMGTILAYLLMRYVIPEWMKPPVWGVIVLLCGVHLSVLYYKKVVLKETAKE